MDTIPLPTPCAAIGKAIAKAGGDAAFMDAMGIRRRTLFYLKRGDRLSLDRALKIEGLFGVPRHELRPDVFEVPVEPAQVAA